LQIAQLPRQLAQLIFHALFLPLHLAESVLGFLFFLFGRAKPFQQITRLSFRIVNEYAKSIMDFEKLALHF